MLIRRTSIAAFFATLLLLMSPGLALAHNSHITFTPDVAAYETLTRFTITTTQQTDDTLQSIRVELPKGLHHVSSVVKSGWTASVTGESIEWQGQLVKSQTLDLTFIAVTPAEGESPTFKIMRSYDSGLKDEHDFTVRLEEPEEIAGRGEAGVQTAKQTSRIALAFSFGAFGLCAASLLVLRKQTAKNKKPSKKIVKKR